MEDDDSKIGEDTKALREFRRRHTGRHVGLGSGSDWKPVDWIACCFTVVLGVILVIGTVSILVNGNDNDEKIKVMAGIISSVVSIVSMYVGASIQKRRDG
jgi:hypothetical protein